MQDVCDYRVLIDHFEIGKQDHWNISPDFFNYHAVMPENRNGAHRRNVESSKLTWKDLVSMPVENVAITMEQIAIMKL